MKYTRSIILVDPKKDKELAKKLKKAGISKSEFHRRNTDAYLQKRFPLLLGTEEN
jgi:hypothetical protein